MQAVVGIVLKAIVTELVIVPIVQLKVLVLLAASVAGVVLLLVLVVVLARVSQKAFVPIVAVVAGFLLVLVVVLALVSQKAFVPIVAVVPGPLLALVLVLVLENLKVSVPVAVVVAGPIPPGIGLPVEPEPIILPVLPVHFTSTMLQELLPPRFMTAVQLALFGISFLGTKLFKPTPTSPLKSEPQTLPF